MLYNLVTCAAAYLRDGIYVRGHVSLGFLAEQRSPARDVRVSVYPAAREDAMKDCIHLRATAWRVGEIDGAPCAIVHTEFSVNSRVALWPR